MFVCLKLQQKKPIINLIHSGIVGRESLVDEKFALYADICNLVSGFLATDYMSFLQSLGTQDRNMRPNRFSHIYIHVYIEA